MYVCKQAMTCDSSKIRIGTFILSTFIDCLNAGLVINGPYLIIYAKLISLENLNYVSVSHPPSPCSPHILHLSSLLIR